MRFIDRLRGGFRRAAVEAAPTGPAFTEPTGRRRGFAIIDVETTGLSASLDRVIELAIVRADGHGRIVDEWVCRFNPQGPVGATHIHGITDADVANAPLFQDLLPTISARLDGLVAVAHNARFDLAFLRQEYKRAGWSMPFVPALCTLDAGRQLLPHLGRYRLADCCAATGVPLSRAHSALYDAHAVAGLLAVFLGRREVSAYCAELIDQAAVLQWPTAAAGPVWVGALLAARRHARRVEVPRLAEVLDRMRLADALDEGAPEGSLAFLELLAQVLEDGAITAAEREAMAELAAAYHLDGDAQRRTHRAFVLALAHCALEDGKVTRDERAELQAVSELLDVDPAEIKRLLDVAEHSRQARLSAGLQPLPSDWPYGEPLRVGDKVVFTGCDPDEREQLEDRAESLGVRVVGSVSARIAMLVTDGAFTGTKATEAASIGLRTVDPATFGTLLQHLQPAAPRVASGPVTKSSEAPRAVLPGPRSPGEALDPSVVRTWARSQGIVVGERGRLPAAVFAAYADAHHKNA
jgi:DNA polymerase-3 subunit epsilon